MTSALMQPDLFEVDERLSDPQADDYCTRVPAALRRGEGITFTPEWLVDRMLDHCAQLGDFDTIVDPGAGSGRFAIAAAKRFPLAQVLAIERNAELAAQLRQRLQGLQLTNRVRVIEGDFRNVAITTNGRVLYVGNPPYVRHHDVDPAWKRWFGQGMAAHGIEASQLAGLHAHFVLRIAQMLKPGDAWCLVTAAEWLDNGYGSALRDLMTAPTGMGLRSIWLAAADEAIFPDALVSAVVVAGQFGQAAAAETPVELGQLRRAASSVQRSMPAAELLVCARWSVLCQPADLPSMEGVELGELFKVTRGQVTGMNQAWVLPLEAPLPWRELGVLAVTRAREIIDGTVVAADAASRLRRVVNLPRDLDMLAPALREAATELMDRARQMGADQSYIAQQRPAWYAVGMREPPLAFVSYMGRRPPVFQPNPHRVSYLNIAHGLYPRIPISPTDLQRVLNHLNTSTGLYSGRVYGGGLAKFEPSDVARLRLPPLIWALPS